MIKEYIEERRIETIHRKEELEKKYSEVSEREKEIKLMVSRIKEELIEEYDLFSPRSFERMANTQLYELEKELKDVILKKQELKRQIREKEKILQKMEQMRKEAETEKLGESIALSKEKVREIVDKLDDCLSLMYNDRNTCKSELKQMRRYLKSFIRK